MAVLVYRAVGGLWTRYGATSIDPSPDFSPQYPSSLTYPSWGLYPGTGG